MESVALNVGTNVGLENVPTNWPTPYVNTVVSAVTCHALPNEENIVAALEFDGSMAPLGSSKSSFGLLSQDPRRPLVNPKNELGVEAMTPRYPPGYS